MSEAGTTDTNELRERVAVLKSVKDRLHGRIAATWDRNATVHVRSDFDGTATEFIKYPEESEPMAKFVRALNRIAEVPKTTVGMITGRFLAFAMRHFPNPKIQLDCSYGAETRHNGQEWQADHIEAGKAPLAAIERALVEAIEAEGGRTSTSSREAEANGWIYIEVAPTKVAAHTRAGIETNPELPRILNRAVERLAASPRHDVSEFFGLVLKDNNMNLEFDIPGEDGERVEKRDVVAALIGLEAVVDVEGRPVRDADKNIVYVLPEGREPNLVTFSGDDKGDVLAAQLVKEYGGFVFVIRQEGTPQELIDCADFVFESVAEHAAFQDWLGRDMQNLAKTTELTPG